MSKASSPGKIILFGEHFVVYGVNAILCAIDKRITVTSEKIKKHEIKIFSNIGELILNPNTPLEKINSPLKPFYYLANKFLDKHSSNHGIKIIVDSQIPPGVGLGSSSACCVAGAASISGLFENLSKEKILELAIDAEKTIYEKTSGADCTVCTYGGIMLFNKKKGFRKIESKPNFQLVIANSKIIHSTDRVVSNVREFKENNEGEFLKLCKNEEKLIEDVLLKIKNNEIKQLGEHMKENQKYLEVIGVSNDTLRNMIRASNNSSFGSKITGAGGGGCIFALTDENNLDNTIRDLTRNKFECFAVNIDYEGLDTF